MDKKKEEIIEQDDEFIEAVGDTAEVYEESEEDVK